MRQNIYIYIYIYIYKWYREVKNFNISFEGIELKNVNTIFLFSVTADFYFFTLRKNSFNADPVLF